MDQILLYGESKQIMNIRNPFDASESVNMWIYYFRCSNTSLIILMHRNNEREFLPRHNPQNDNLSLRYLVIF